MALKYADVPVVVAPAGLALGGGCEIVLHADRVQAAAETYIGLVEVGVGLIPAGGGTKEMLIAARSRPPRRRADLLPYVQRGVRDHGVRQGLHQRARCAAAGLPAADRRHHDEPRAARSPTRRRGRWRARAEGYQPPAPPTAIPVGGESLLAALTLGVHLALARRPRSASTTRSSAGSSRGFWRADRCRTRRPSPSSTCSISSAKRSSACAASRRRWSGSATR